MRYNEQYGINCYRIFNNICLNHIGFGVGIPFQKGAVRETQHSLSGICFRSDGRGIGMVFADSVDRRSGEHVRKLSFIPAAVGFILGGLFLVLIDKLVPHIHGGTNQEEGLPNHLNKPIKLFLAVTIHNIPEGLAVGFAFGAAAALGEHGAFVSALGLAIGMAIQNFPEGAAISLPMKAATDSKGKAFLYGMGSGAVEPVFAVIGYFMAAYLTSAQPWLLAFAAGAMIFVVIEDLIPDAHLSEHSHLGTWGAMLGFVVMMTLDVALG